MPVSFRSFLVLASLIAVLAMAPVAPEAGNAVFLGTACISLFVVVRGRAQALRRPLSIMTLSWLVLLGIAYVAGAKSVDGMFGLVFFAPVFAIWPLLSIADDLEVFDSFSIVGALAFCGVAGATVLAVSEVVATGTTRAGGVVANPIHFADVVLLAGFVATTGLIARSGLWRLVFLIAPLFAVIAVVLSGTRGALVAAAVMVAVAGVAMAALRLLPLRAMLLSIAGLVAAGGLGLWLGGAQLSGVQRVLIDIVDVLRVGLPTDESTSIRLQMYIGGLRAFLDAPIFGHGPLEFVEVAKKLADVQFENAPHLHSDIADFAASGGVVGLIAYILFMCAPIVEVLRAPASWAKPRILVLTLTLMAGFFVMGLTNAMFGILTVTIAYTAICVITGILVSQANKAGGG